MIMTIRSRKRHRTIFLVFFISLHRSTFTYWPLNMENEELIQLHHRLQALRLEHSDLDAAIHALQASAYVDQLQLRRMKKRKLQLKDAIARIESKLIPDLNA